MSGLFRRLSSRRSEGPEGTEPLPAADPGTTDAPAPTPADSSGRQSLLTDPAAPTQIISDAQPEPPTQIIPDGGTEIGQRGLTAIPPAEPPPAVVQPGYHPVPPAPIGYPG